MNILAVMGSYRKGKSIDTLLDRAIEGAKSNNGVHVDKLVLIDRNIEYCRNCMVCRNDDSHASMNAHWGGMHWLAVRAVGIRVCASTMAKSSPESDLSNIQASKQSTYPMTPLHVRSRVPGA